MIRKIIVTDVTHFKNEQIVCVAGIDINTGECIRPIKPDYLSHADVKRLNITPSAILSGAFQLLHNAQPPHIEDAHYRNLKIEGYCSKEEFKQILSHSVVSNIEDGFNIKLESNQKHIPVSNRPAKSIITISVSPKTISIFKDSEYGDKVKIHFTDKNSKNYRFMPVTDLRYCAYAKEGCKIDSISSFIQGQDELFLRIGLGRFYKSPHDNREGYWLQVNGIYCFSNKSKNI